MKFNVYDELLSEKSQTNGCKIQFL